MNNPTVLKLDESGNNRPTQARIRIRVPKKYHREAVLSQLVLHHGLEVNILSAILGGNGEGDGWFDLQLFGTSQQIDDALIELTERDIQILDSVGTNQDGW
ncbi:NIL domain-containing protein [Oscillatoria sp. FACHB-1406]|uniref:NIL domain-containing protein n=1 Tax=Oscillatoria sp. FACHB-1406 TaxID=2692846 RepID=UPI001687221D|nr:NIL domain-containing protein [Oscillatoria sp. FACHB-1406]MBD2579239.1 NIL domain-containing protein [Oscillatoria sp. FACHB-1406]